MSQKQLIANRRNAKHSTGPTSKKGKSVSRLNAVKHALLAQQVVVRGYFQEESSAEFKRLCQEYHQNLAPVGPLEEMLVGQIVMVVWRLRRVRTAEAGEIATSVDKTWWNPRRPPWEIGNGHKANALLAENFQLPDEVNQIAQAIAQGDPTALQRLTDYSKSQHQFFNTNQVGLTNEQLSALSYQAFGGLRSAFDFLAAEAIKGNPNARQAIDQAVRSGYLEGTAVQALGKLAGNGDEAALQTLLNYDKNGILLSSAVDALGGPAGNGNEPAIAILAAVLKDDSKKPLWHLASTGLQKAAANGNAVALDALKSAPQQ